MATDSLLRDIEHLSRLPGGVGDGYREVFSDVVVYAKKRFAEQLKQEKVIKKD